MPAVEALLTKTEVGRLARLHVRTIDRMVSANLIPEPIRVGTGRRRRVRWRASVIDQWLRLGCPDRATFEAAKREGEGVPT
jgi:predicted DNA-binding transcriptional regulator AlpA